MKKILLMFAIVAISLPVMAEYDYLNTVEPLKDPSTLESVFTSKDGLAGRTNLYRFLSNPQRMLEDEWCHAEVYENMAFKAAVATGLVITKVKAKGALHMKPSHIELMYSLGHDGEWARVICQLKSRR